MAGSRSRDTAILIRKAAQFAAGFGTTKGDPTGVATAGTAQQFGKPTLGQQVRGGFSAISPAFRSFEESRAGVERSSAVTNLALEEARQLRLEEEQKRKPVNLRNLTGGFITERTQKKLEEALDANADGFTTQGELEKGLPKLDKQIIVDAISEDIEEFTKNKKQNESNVTALIEQANKKMLGTGTTVTKQDFQTNPELGRTFPKIAEAITRQDSVQNKIDVLASKRISINDVLKREAGIADPLAGITPSTREIIRAEKDPRIKAALKEKQRQKIEVAQAQRTAIIEATQEADLNKVLPPDQIIKFINRDTGRPAEFGMTNRDLTKGNFVPVTTAQKGAIAALGSADNIIKTMQPVVDRLFTAGGFVSRVGETAGVIFQREFIGETDAVFYEALKEGVIGQFVKIVGGESGSRLSDQDIKRMRGLFPAMHAGIFGLIDTRKTSQRKMRFLVENMEKLRSDILSKIGVTPVGTLAEKLTETLPELPRGDIGTFNPGKQSELDALIGGQ